MAVSSSNNPWKPKHYFVDFIYIISLRPYNIYHIATATGPSLEDIECPVGQNRRLKDTPEIGGVRGEGDIDATPVKEIQVVSCDATAGSFRVSFRGHSTTDLPFDASDVNLRDALESIPTIGRVKVVSSEDPPSLCASGGATSTITFLTELGNLPLLLLEGVSLSGGAAAATVTTSAGGKGYLLECGGKGKCDKTTGECKCWPNWGSSDGYGDPGFRGDCGASVVV
jgi:hypothetical protein